jgi:hypothetical protein
MEKAAVDELLALIPCLRAEQLDENADALPKQSTSEQAEGKHIEK